MKYFITIITVFVISLISVALGKESIQIPYILQKQNIPDGNCEIYYYNCLKRPCGYHKFLFWRYYLSEKDIEMQCKTEYNNCINQKYY